MRAASVIAFAVWIGMIAAGFGWLARYELRPGEVGDVSPRWPAASHMERDAGRGKLVMFLHPHCPCSPASFLELNELRSESAENLQARLVLCKPAGVPAGWEQTSLWKQAIALSG